jgi:LTXXQ motif family protein
MKSVIRTALIFVGFASVPAAAAVFGSFPFTLPHVSFVTKDEMINVSVREKNPARIMPAATDGQTWTWTRGLIGRGQVRGPLGNEHGVGDQDFFSDNRLLPGLPPRPGARNSLGFAPPLGLPSPRIACEGEIDHLMALVGYLKSKMRLQGDQKTSWQKVEESAEPGVEKLRDLCGQLPSRPAQLPTLVEAMEFAEKQMTARAELLHEIRGPIQALYDALLPDQRALLVPPPPPLPLPLAEDSL